MRSVSEVAEGGAQVPHDVFISYAREDQRLAEAVALKLQGETIEAWSDRRLGSGEFFPESINAALQASKAVLCLWSKASVSSEWVKAEALAGFERRTLAPIRVGQCDIPVPFNGLHTLNFVAWNDNVDHPEWRALIEQLARLLGRPALREWAQRSRPTALQDLAQVAARYPDDPIVAKASALALSEFGVDLAQFEFEADDGKSGMLRLAEEGQRPAQTMYDAKRRQLEEQAAEDREEEQQQLRWALGVAHRTQRLLNDLEVLFPKWKVEFHEHDHASSDLANLIAAGPANPTQAELDRAYEQLYEEDEEGRPCHHHFVEAGAFIEQSEISLTCGEFSANVNFREKSSFVYVDLGRDSPLRCEVPDHIWEEIERFEPPTFNEFLAIKGKPSDYFETISLLQAWLHERFVEWCAIQSIDPNKLEEAAHQARTTATSVGSAGTSRKELVSAPFEQASGGATVRGRALLRSWLGSWILIGGVLGIGIGVGEQWGVGAFIFGPLAGIAATLAFFWVYYLAVDFVDRTIMGPRSSVTSAMVMYWVIGPVVAVGAIYWFMSAIQ